MQITCLTEELRKNLQIVQRAVANKGVLPVLSNVLITTDDSAEELLKIVATDLEIGIETSLTANVEGQIHTTIPARTLTEIVNKFPDKKLQINFDESGTAKLVGEKSNFKLNTLSPEDFPQLPRANGSGFLSLNTRDFSQAIRQTIFATATDASKNILTGIYMEVKEGQVKLGATDGYRLAERKIESEQGGDNMAVIIPSRTLAELEKLLKQSSQENFQMACKGNQVIFQLDGKVLTSRLIEGKYPDYTKILPKEFDKTALLDTKLFLDAVERAAIMASEQTHVISLELQANEMTISAGAELGQAKESLEIQYEGESLSINFNARYLIDALKILLEDMPTLLFQFNGEVQPAVLKGLNEDNYVCMLMPIKP